jgi:hypothetical protein
MSFLADSLRPHKQQRRRRDEPVAERIGTRSSAVRKKQSPSKPLKKHHEVDRRSVGKVGEPPTWDQCRAPNCLKKPSSAHGLCHDHGKQIADAFELFYVAAQKVVEGLATWEIKPLPKAQIDDPFIRHCDQFLEDAIPHWLEDQDAPEKIESRRKQRKTR